MLFRSRSLVAYMADPKPINDMLAAYGTSMGWAESQELNAFAVEVMKKDGLVSDGGDGILGNMDCARVQTLIDEFNPLAKAVGNEGVKDGLKCEDIVDNQFIDNTVSFGS